jgi:hypothetical protein
MSSNFVRWIFSQSSWRLLLATLGLFVLASDLLLLAFPTHRLWYLFAFYGIGSALVIGTVVGVAGFVGWVRIADPRWRAIGVAHMTAYLMVALLLGLSLALRMEMDASPILAVILSGVAIALYLSSTWLDEQLGQLSRERAGATRWASQ